MHPLIEQVCVIGDALPQPMALCVLSEAGRRQAEGMARVELEGSFRALLDEVNKVLDKHERLLTLVLLTEVWAIDNGFLTPTLKIKRAVVENTYQRHFDDWINRRETVLWHS